MLNALGGGSVQGYLITSGGLPKLPGSKHPLGLDPSAAPQFTNTPGQVAFSPGGTRLIVTTKANGNDIGMFGIRGDGRLTAAPVVNPEPGTVPFAISFDQAGHLVIAEARGTNALATFAPAPATARSTQLAAGRHRPGRRPAGWPRPADCFFASNAAALEHHRPRPPVRPGS